MDDRRFDLIAKGLGASTARRGALGVLAELGLLLAVPAWGEAKRKKRKKRNKKKKKTRPVCPMETLDRCAEPVLETLVASTESCRAGCADPASNACRACLDPAVDQATRDIAACLEQTCRGGTGPTEAGGEPTAATVRAASAVAAQAASCNSAAYDTCVDRNNRDLATCLGKELLACDNPRSCIVDLGGCVVESRNRASDCIADHGCKGGGYCKQNICCPHWADTVCNGACCRTHNCETCQNGVCKGCGKEQVCTVSPAQVRECRCTRNRQECGDQCCDPQQCEECAFVDGVGTCFSTCPPQKVCEPGTFSGSCVCPSGTEECSELCCDKAKCETCAGNGFCRGCQPPKVCRDKQCRCPQNTTPCGMNNCCGPEQICISGGCACVDGTPCNGKCCPSGQECVDGACKEKTCGPPPLCDANACEKASCDPVTKTWTCKFDCPFPKKYCENGRCTKCRPGWVRCPDDNCDSGDCCCMPGLICGCRKGTCCKEDGTGCEGC